MIEIVYQTENIVVCIKPVGISSESDGLVRRLSEQLNSPIFPLHRLDQAVGGLMVYAKNKTAAARLSKDIQNHKMEKEYLAVVKDVESLKDSDTLTDQLYHDRKKNKAYVVSSVRKGTKEAVLSYRTVERSAGLRLVRVSLETGRSHQIRVQFSSRKAPLVGDGKYGFKANCNIALYSCHLYFKEPMSHQSLSFTCYPACTYPWDQFEEIRNHTVNGG